MVEAMKFNYCGTLSASKSILNRLLIVQSFAPKLQIVGDSTCDDVIKMREALKIIASGGNATVNAGSAGTTFRFLALRLSRMSGRHLLLGSESLLKRPQTELIRTLSQLGVQAEFVKDGGRLSGMTIVGDGWVDPQKPILMDGSESSQFASAVLLAALGLSFDLVIERVASSSEGYFEMTMATLAKAGMNLEITPGKQLKIPAGSRVTAASLGAELDVSSAIAVAALGAVGGSSIIKNFPVQSLQPDRVFVPILKKMGVDIVLERDVLKINRALRLTGIEQDLGNAPDLFPVLAVLCSLAQGTSRLFGAKQLIHKESNRLRETETLLNCVGARFETHDDGMTIHGGLLPKPNKGPIVYDPAQDHRMAMAAALLNLAGANLEILTPEVVDKSFPEFWSLFPKKSLAVNPR